MVDDIYADAQTEQRMTALTAANAIRTKRKELKERMAVGQEDARELLAQPPELIENVEIGEFLRWVPRIGKSKAREIARKARVSPSRPLVNLSPRERTEVAQLLPAVKPSKVAA